MCLLLYSYIFFNFVFCVRDIVYSLYVCIRISNYFYMNQIWQDEQLGRIEIYSDRRARRIILRPVADGVRITVPLSYDVLYVRNILEKYRERLSDKQQMMKKHTVMIDRDFCIETDVFSLKLAEGSRNGYYVNTDGMGSVLVCPSGTDYTMVQEMLRKAVVEIMRKHAKRFLPHRLDALAGKYGFFYNTVSIRSSRTRWGSCSSGRNIALSLYLMELPSELIDYVIKHELCHTVEMNHGPRFWDLMDKVTDGKAEELRKRVREHGMLVI